MADCDATLSHYQFDIPKTEGKPGIEPNTVVDNLNGKTKALVGSRRGFFTHSAIFPQAWAIRPLS
jgi:hypothetical protein